MLPLAVTTDVVIFTIRRKALQLLLIKRKKSPFRDVWALPGGFAGAREGLETSAMRQLEEETGLRGLYLEQLYTFGDPQRDSRQRVICVAYYALVPSERPSAVNSSVQVAVAVNSAALEPSGSAIE